MVFFVVAKLLDCSSNGRRRGLLLSRSLLFESLLLQHLLSLIALRGFLRKDRSGSLFRGKRQEASLGAVLGGLCKVLHLHGLGHPVDGNVSKTAIEQCLFFFWSRKSWTISTGG